MWTDIIISHGSYDTAAVLANTQSRATLIMLVGAASFIGGFLQMIGAVRIGFRQATYGAPLICTLWFFAHDFTYLLNWQHWTYEAGFPQLRYAWVQMIFYCALEVVVLWQTLRYGYKEAFPGLTLPQAVIACIGLQIFAIALFLWFRSMIGDPFHLFAFASTALLGPIANIAFMRQRGSRRGISRAYLVGTLIIAVSFWTWMLLSDPGYFTNPALLVVMAGGFLLSLGALAYYRILPPEPAQ